MRRRHRWVALAVAGLIGAAAALAWWRGGRLRSPGAGEAVELSLPVRLGHDVHLLATLGGSARGGEVNEAALEGALAATLPSDPDALVAATRDPTARGRLLAELAGEAAAAGLDLERLRLADSERSLHAFVRERARRAMQPGRPVVLLGWDGADPRVIEDLRRAGRMANLSRLAERGSIGRLRSHPPFLSPLLWTSIATGKQPGEHGILDFVEMTAGGQAIPVRGACRRATPLWEIASDLGRRVLVVNWWATDPPEDVNGEVVSDRWVRGGSGVAGPDPALRVAKGDAVVSEVLAGIGLRGPAVEPREERLREFVAETLTVQRVLAARLAAARFDLVLGYSGLPDQAAHLFVQEMPPRQPEVDEERYRRYGGVVHGTYLLLDRLLGELLAVVPADAIVAVISDHGFVYGRERTRAADHDDPLSDALHSREGIYLVAGSGRGTSARLDLHQIAPTVLAWLGIPPAADMAGGAAVELLDGVPPPPVASHETRVEPPPLALLEGQPCTAAVDPLPAGDGEIDKLRALGYVASQGGGLPVLPLANLGRSLLDQGTPAAAVAALERAASRRPRDPQLGFLLLEALIRLPGVDAARVESLARRHLVSEDGAVRGEFAFVLAELLLLGGRSDEARVLAKQAEASGADGALTALLVAAFQGDRTAAGWHLRVAAAIDPVRTVDTVQALVEVFPERDLGVDALVAILAAEVPLGEVLRAPVGVMGKDPRETLRRARGGTGGLARDPVRALWSRRAAAWDPDYRTSEGGVEAFTTGASGGRPETRIEHP